MAKLVYVNEGKMLRLENDGRLCLIPLKLHPASISIQGVYNLVDKDNFTKDTWADLLTLLPTGAADVAELGSKENPLQVAGETPLETGGPSDWQAFAEMLAMKTEERIAKRARVTVTNHAECGEVLIEAAENRGRTFLNEVQLAAWQRGPAAAVLESPAGQEAQQMWEQAASEEDLQAALNKIIPPLLLRLRNSRDVKYYDTHLSGLMGRQVKIDGIIADRYKQMPYVGTYFELKKLRSGRAEGVGQAWDRVRQMQDDQDRRDFWVSAVIGKEDIQLWQFPASRKGSDLSTHGASCTGVLAFSLDITNPGFQLFVQWLATPFEALGYHPPILPGSVLPIDGKRSMEIESKVLENASLSDLTSRARGGVIVYKGFVKPEGEAAIAKLPGKEEVLEIEAINLEIVSHIEGVAENTVRLLAKSNVNLLGTNRGALILQPVGQLLPLNMPPEDLVQYVRHLVQIIQKLYEAGYLHCDLSYFNLLMYQEKPLLADLQTLRTVARAAKSGVLTGTPLFAGLDVIQHGRHSLGTELETVMNVVIYVLSGGILFWRHKAPDDHELPSLRFGVMANPSQFEAKVLSRVPQECHLWIRRLRDLFYPQGQYTTGVTCDQYLKACYL